MAFIPAATLLRNSKPTFTFNRKVAPGKIDIKTGHSVRHRDSVDGEAIP
jgi:hypothetical protein